MKRYLWMLTLLVTCLILTACGAAPAVDKVTVTNDQFLTADANFAAPEIQAFLEQQNSPLAVYSETEEGVVYTAADMFWIASQSNDYGLSPRALLTTLALENGLTWNKQGGLLPYLKNMAANLAASANAYEIENARESTLSGAKTITIGNNSNAATYAITQYLAPLASDSDQLNQWLDVWADTFQVFFQEASQVTQFIYPQIHRSLSLIQMRKLHNVHRFNFLQQLKHFFLAITGGLSNNHIGEMEKRTGITDGKAIG